MPYLSRDSLISHPALQRRKLKLKLQATSYKLNNLTSIDIKADTMLIKEYHHDVPTTADGNGSMRPSTSS